MLGIARPKARSITRMLISAAAVVACGALAAAPGGADPSPFSTLSSSCNQSPGRDAIIQGIRRGIADWSPSAPHNFARSTCGVNPAPAPG